MIFVSCPYYWWNHDYACRKSGKDVNEDIYYKYCRNYSYDACPIYKQEAPSDSRCFLTTACIKSRNLSDDCHELTVLRNFRDAYVLKQPAGKQDVEYYYEVAPRIIAKINEQRKSNDVYCEIYEKLVLPCVSAIEKGQHDLAYGIYMNYFLNLERKYL